MSFIFRLSQVSSTSLFRNPVYIAGQLRTLRQHAKSKLARDTGPTARGATGVFRPELARFLNKATATPLIQTSSLIPWRIGSYILGTSFFAYSIINFITFIWDPPHPPSYFVKATNLSIDIGMTVLGVYFFLRTRRIVSNISAVPYVVNANTGQKGLALRIETYRVLPSFGHKVIEVPADTVITTDSLGIPGSYVSTPLPPTREEWKAEQRWIKNQQRKRHKNAVVGIVAMPFERFGQLIVRGFQILRELLTEDNFMHLRIKGKHGIWKVERDFIWALDNGHAFDKLVKTELF